MSKSIRQLTAYCLWAFSSSALALPDSNPAVISHAELGRLVLGLALVLAIIFILSWLVKRLNSVNLGINKGFQYIGSMVLGPKEKIMLVKVGDLYLLMGVTSGAVNLLYDFGTQLPEGFDPENKTSFAQILKSAVGKS